MKVFFQFFLQRQMYHKNYFTYSLGVTNGVTK